MKTIRHIIGLTAALLLVGACSKGAYSPISPSEDYSSSTSPADGPDGKDGTNCFDCIATVKQKADGTLFLQVDDALRVTPQVDPTLHLFSHPYTRPYRLMCLLTVLPTVLEDGSCAGIIAWDIPLQEGSVVAGEATIGTDEGLDVLDDWSTSLEDAFLTIRYSVYWSKGIMHSLQIVTGVNPDDPYEVQLLHCANGDSPDEKGDAIIAFDLNTLPYTEGSTLTLKWTTLAGEPAQRKFLFRSRE